jgi:hypothetical protein
MADSTKTGIEVELANGGVAKKLEAPMAKVFHAPAPPSGT